MRLRTSQYAGDVAKGLGRREKAPEARGTAGRWGRGWLAAPRGAGCVAGFRGGSGGVGAPPGAGRAAEAAGAYGGWLGAPFVATMLLSKPKLDKRNQSRSAPNSYLFARAVHSAIMCVSSAFLMCFLFCHVQVMGVARHNNCFSEEALNKILTRLFARL